MPAPKIPHAQSTCDSGRRGLTLTSILTSGNRGTTGDALTRNPTSPHPFMLGETAPLGGGSTLEEVDAMDMAGMDTRTDQQGRELFSDTGGDLTAETLVGTALVGPGGLEPPTSPLSGARSHHLS